MPQLLKLHPSSNGLAGIQVAAEAARPSAHSLTLCYVVTGNINELLIAPLTLSTRTDGLWRHTCFEAFVRAWDAAYYEFNFAPTTQWAAYRFKAYRHGRCQAEMRAPVIDVQSHPDRFVLQAFVQLDSLCGLSGEVSWHLGLSAVIEDTNDRISYWSLIHPSEKPDFHHAASFACELPPSVQA